MSRVEELEQGIESLSPEEFSRLSRWFWEKEQSGWDAQLNRDSAAGKLFLFDEAEQEDHEGQLRPWPPQA